MSENHTPKVSRYFAAANSYNGFISFFDKVFSSENFDRVYVLKGGPGTGKSSFMKKISEALKQKCCNIEEIYCSSDPHSLDGIIAENNGKRIAIIDGTSPHERDAVIPGAIDEIINLGDGWDSRWLTGKRDKIIELGKEKTNAYKCGYAYLKTAGVADKFIFDVYNAIFNRIEAKNKAEEILSDISSDKNPKITTRLISSFGRYGAYALTHDESRTIRVYGDEITRILFLNTLAELAIVKGISFTHFPTPLNPSHTEGINFDSANLFIVKADTGDINSTTFIKNDKIYSERTRRAKEIKKMALEEAERWFSVASELHFQLEEIYGAAMNFEKNEETFNLKLREIENILQI